MIGDVRASHGIFNITRYSQVPWDTGSPDHNQTP